jgi:hypothetical protein
MSAGITNPYAYIDQPAYVLRTDRPAPAGQRNNHYAERLKPERPYAPASTSKGLATDRS